MFSYGRYWLKVRYGKRWTPSITPYSSYSARLNQSCWKLPRLESTLPPIHAAYLLSMLFLLAIIRHLYVLGATLAISALNRCSILGKSDEAPVRIILPHNSFRASPSPTAAREEWASLWIGREDKVWCATEIWGAADDIFSGNAQNGILSEKKSSYDQYLFSTEQHTKWDKQRMCIV